MKRRNFLMQTGAMALSGLLTANKLSANFLSDSAAMRPIGLGLFTLFNVIDQDVTGILKKVAALGYQEIESAFSKKGGYYGMKPQEFAAFTKDIGLTWQSHHVLGAPFKLPPGAKMPTGADGKPISIPPMRNLRDNYQELIDEAAAGGVKYLVCANTPIGTLDEIKSSIDVLNKSAEAAKKAGLIFCYHNHDAEFKKVEGQVPYDMLLSQTDPNNLKMELDLAWAVKGGYDPVALFKQHPGRFPLWHVKDLTQDRQTIQPVGSGTIDFKPIFDQAKLAGLQHFFVEHDMPADPFASISTSIQNLKKLLS
ncbi:sugar phosphate isomerase/epimerase family protein [Adhaeribacter radiodurans]|uniref:Sugar phosphate isomerase/epimerase n=1 Tax=Adhaeribacter radiodurans TaxID=2745197 RepID=A0A7L7LBM7_9BACT|nr:sugar phosphate isomerase/epimerase [Adhaeribacter radiodurans]QMU29945.1 sugar phosphate isomerase/epimerase [Adhaeribacter radiodurans]